MILSRLLLPEPFGPSTPIFAPGRKASVIPSTITRSGGTTLRRSFSVRTNSCGMGRGSLATAAPGASGPVVSQQLHQARAVEASRAAPLQLGIEAVDLLGDRQTRAHRPRFGESEPEIF